MSRREDFVAERQSDKPPEKTRRQKLSGYHPIRHTYKEMPRRKISPVLFMLLVFALIMATSTMGRNAAGAKETVRDRNSPMWQQLLSTVTVMSQGEWGAELLDSCYLLMEDFAEAGDVEASRYMLLLANGIEPGSESEKLIKEIAANPEEAELYRLALEASHQNMLSLSSGSAPAQGSP